MTKKRQLSASALSVMGCRKTGFPDLDRSIGGLWSGDLVLIAACDDSGKTALALNIAEHLALKQGLSAAYFSTHMGVEQITTRLLASIGRISLDSLRTGVMSEHEGLRFDAATQELLGSAIHVEAMLGWEFINLRKRALTLAQRYGRLGLLVIDSLDYLDLRPQSVAWDSVQRSIQLQQCAMLSAELKCPVIALVRISEVIEVRGDARPVLSDLALSVKGLKSIQTILSIYREDQYAAGECLEPGIAQIKVLQNRLGQAASLKLAFLERIAKFESLAFSE